MAVAEREVRGSFRAQNRAGLNIEGGFGYNLSLLIPQREVLADLSETNDQPHPTMAPPFVPRRGHRSQRCMSRCNLHWNPSPNQKPSVRKSAELACITALAKSHGVSYLDNQLPPTISISPQLARQEFERRPHRI